MNRETLRRIFAEQGFDVNGASPHSWRCDYPDRYGNCDCVDEMIDAVLKQTDYAEVRKLQGQANYLLSRIVAAANISAIEGKDGFIQGYDMPTGPIHKAIPFLQEQGIAVTYDGQILNSPEEN